MDTKPFATFDQLANQINWTGEMDASHDDAGGEVEEVDAAAARQIRARRRVRQLPPPVDVAVAVGLVECCDIVEWRS